MRKMISIDLIICIVLAIFFFSPLNSQSEQTQTNDDTQKIKNITIEEAQTLIEKNKDNLIILDVRTSEEYSREHIEDAINIDFYSETFREDLNKLDKDKTYIVHCQIGGRSAKALNTMKELGFKEAYNMGGITQWKENGLPTTK